MARPSRGSIPREFSGMQLDEVVHAYRLLACELEQVVGHTVVAALLVQLRHHGEVLDDVRRLGGWNNSVELQLVGSKDQVSQVHNELTTPSYALVNLRTGYQWQAVRIDFGVDNLFNQYYYLPLGGAALVDYIVVSMVGSSGP